MLVLDAHTKVLGRGTRTSWVQGEFPPKAGLRLRLLCNVRGSHSHKCVVSDIGSKYLQTAPCQSGEIHPQQTWLLGFFSSKKIQDVACKELGYAGKLLVYE